MKKTRTISDLAEAVGFLTRLPVPAHFFAKEPAGAAAAWAYPLAGAFAALPAAILFAVIFSISGHGSLAALLALSLYILVTGALHEDGLADCADGLFGGKTAEDVHMIMKDSRIGTYAALALIFSIGLRASALAGTASAGVAFAACALVTAAAAGRAVMLLHWRALGPAKNNGAAATLGQPSDQNVMTGCAAALPFLAILTAISSNPVAVIFAAFTAGLTAFSFTRFTRRRIAGHTGDTLGATAQLGETVFLVTLAISI